MFFLFFKTINNRMFWDFFQKFYRKNIEDKVQNMGELEMGKIRKCGNQRV